MIPKIGHFIWLGSDLPDFAKQSLEEFERYHSGWTVNLVTSQPTDMPVRLKESIDKCKYISQVADIIRVWLLYRDGGVYSDLDVYWVRSMDDLTGLKNFVYANGTQLKKVKRDRFPRRFKHFNNAVMGSEGQTEFFKDYMDYICHAVNVDIENRMILAPLALAKLVPRRTDCNVLPPQSFAPLYRSQEVRDKFPQLSFDQRWSVLMKSSWRWKGLVPPYGVHVSIGSTREISDG